MKQLLSIVLYCTFLNTAYSQTISPVNTVEFCPNTEYTFTVNIPKPYLSMLGDGNSVVTQPPQIPVGNIFTFKGKFGDVNLKQTFRINYTDNTFFIFEFKRIKSLFFSATSSAFPPCNIVRPNQVQPIIFPRCQAASITISFPNIQWFTTFENPEICFGTVTDYEYQLPANWSIGNNNSTGSNWIAGGNSAVVTSDLSTGDGADIRIRASNKTCGTALAANGPVSTVRISRPEPPLSITAPQVIICTGSSADYTLNNIPTGATVLWTYTSNSGGSVNLTNPTLATVTVTNTTTGNASITLIATVSHCSFTYTRNIAISLGKGVNTVNYTMMTIGCQNRRAYFYANVQPVIGSTNYAWYSKDMSNPNNPFVYKDGGFDYYNIDFPLGAGNKYYTVYVNVTTPCGNVQSNLGEGYFYAPSCSGTTNKVSISPNPSKNNITLQLLDEEGKTETINILEIRIYDKLGNEVLLKKIALGQKSVTLNVSSLKPDTYFVKIWNGESWITSQLSKQ